VEHRAHHVVVVTGEDADAGATLPVPDSDGLVVRCRNNPGVLVMEHGSSDVVKMAEQSENATFLFVIPDFDFVVVTPGDEQGLLVVETNPSDGSVVFVEFLEQCAHPIVPKLDGAIVQAS
jgi:hypothetical protein